MGKVWRKNMKQAILERLQALGGDISLVKGESLAEDLCTITFDTVLYQKPLWTPWTDANGEEPIDGLGEFLDANLTLYQADKERFFQKRYETYFILNEVPYGQYFWLGEMFTPFQEGTRDFETWHEVFQGEIYSFETIFSVTEANTTDLIHLFYGYGYPDGIYIASQDKNADNPRVFATDHEAWFIEIDDEGDLESYLHSFWTKEELRAEIEGKLG